MLMSRLCGQFLYARIPLILSSKIFSFGDDSVFLGKFKIII